MFQLILISIPALTLAWWGLGDRFLAYSARRAKPSRHRSWWRRIQAGRVLLAGFALALLGSYAVPIAGQWLTSMTGERVEWKLPAAWQSMGMLWGVLILPGLALPGVMVWAVYTLIHRDRTRAKQASSLSPDTNEAPAAEGREVAPNSNGSSPGVSRREAMGMLAVSLPALATVGVTAYSEVQRRQFRINAMRVGIPNLPDALEGMTIAHLSDTHVGRLTKGPVLRAITDATNDLKPDLIAFTGDLVNHHPDDLVDAVAMLERLEPRDRVLVCEGNHDLFIGRTHAEGRAMFHRAMAQSSLPPLLFNRSATVALHGETLRLIGLGWGTPFSMLLDQAWPMDQRRRDQDAGVLPILLAHHPHAFDVAADAGVPLTLAGHTHGGQFMATSRSGAGPLLFKYWSGLYMKHYSRLVVSNGVGNWFPVRINAPAEIVHLTLTRA